MGNYLQKQDLLDEFKTIKSLKYMPDSYFVNGKKVRVINNKDYVKHIQSSCGGWDESMSECINQICTVLTVDHDKTVQIATASKKKWLFNRAALEPLDTTDYGVILDKLILHENNETVKERKTSSEDSPSLKKDISYQHQIKPDTPSKPKEFKIGDLLQVSSNEKLIQEKQHYCGGYSKSRMHDLMGKRVLVKYFSRHCVKVEKDGKEYDLHPDILDYPKSVKEPPSKKDPIVSEKNTHLFFAIAEGDVEKLLQIIDEDTLNIQNHVGKTPINVACCHGNQEIVELLIQFGADLNIPDNLGNLPIHNCARKGHNEILKFILQKFPNLLNKKTQNGLTLLNIARQKKNKDLEMYLLTNNTVPVNRISQSVGNSLEISLLYPPTTLAHQNLDDTRVMSIKYPSSNISTSLMDPFRDESILSDLPGIQEFDTIEVPSIPIIRSSMADSSNFTIVNSSSVKNECTICRDGQMNTAFVKCGHLTCKKCADRIFKCHICNAEIEEKILIYL